MDEFLIEGQQPLNGTIEINGSKNSGLPILIATLLTDEECVINKVPDLRDIQTTFQLLKYLGKSVEYKNHTVTIKSDKPLKYAAPYELVKQMRASILVAGPLLARLKKTQVPLPGGCAIGLRPIDIHLKGFEEFGAKTTNVRGDILISVDKLVPTRFRMEFPSVGATENLIMCATLMPGKTILSGVAKEPEIDDLMDFLNKMGANVKKHEPDEIIIEGKPSLGGATHTLIPDRIETGTFLIAGAITGGNITLANCRVDHLKSVIDVLEYSGAKISADGDTISVSGPKDRPRPVNVNTLPHPGFPTDLQAPWMSYMCIAKGKSKIEEDIFENRFIHTAELARMGANILVDGKTALIEGVESLNGASVMASDIRGGAALVVATLCAKGQSVVQRSYHIDRGYEKIEDKLSKLGARITRQKSK
jgi:UDP-N-acetylglucosamine 1-carboxyvinyltransferase